MSTIRLTDASGDNPVAIRITNADPATGARQLNTSPPTLALSLSQEDADQLTAQLIERQLNRWRDSDTDSYEHASSGVATGLRAAMAYLTVQYGEGIAEEMVEAALEVWSDLPEEHARRITDAGWELN